VRDARPGAAQPEPRPREPYRRPSVPTTRHEITPAIPDTPAGPAPHPTTEPANPPASAPPTDPRTLGRESQMLARALAELRQAHRPTRALAILDAYDARYPHGALALEAQAARVDALLSAGQSRAAHEALEKLALDGLPRGNELRVVRAEL